MVGVLCGRTSCVSLFQAAAWKARLLQVSPCSWRLVTDIELGLRVLRQCMQTVPRGATELTEKLSWQLVSQTGA